MKKIYLPILGSSLPDEKGIVLYFADKEKADAFLAWITAKAATTSAFIWE